MFERFTDRARRAIVLAQDEARRLEHNYIGTEHLLLGILAERSSVAGKALEAMRISLNDVRADVEEIIGRGGGEPSGQIPFTPRAKKVLELSLREAKSLGHNYIGTEHILLGLLREGEGVACQVLERRGIGLGDARQQIIALLAGEAQERYVEPETHLFRPPTEYTPEARRALRMALRESVAADNEEIGTEHILLGLLQEPEGTAAQILGEMGVETDAVRRRIKELDERGGEEGAGAEGEAGERGGETGAGAGSIEG